MIHDRLTGTLRPFILHAISIAILTGCSVQSPFTIQKRLEFERTPSNSREDPAQEDSGTKKTEIRNISPPAPRAAAESRQTPKTGGPQVVEPSDITVNFEQLSLPAFIKAVYGSVLKRNVVIDQDVSAKTDLVTFRTARPLSATRVAELTKQVLKGYGVSVQDLEGVVRITTDTATNSYLPQIRRGRALPDVPEQLRPIFHLIEMEYVNGTTVSNWLKTILANRVTVQDDSSRNAVLVSGQREEVNAAIEMIASLDQPTLRGSQVRVIKPVYWSADEFSKRLTEVLSAQGLSVSNSPGSNSPVLLIPIQALNSIAVFTTSSSAIALVVKWAEELDRPSSSSGAGGSVFTYQVKHADAQELAKVVGDLMGAPVAGGSSQAGSNATTGLSAPAAPVAPRAPTGSNANSSSPRIVVNPSTNTLIIQGSKPDDYRQWLGLLADLDRPVRAALVEVMVAEVRLTGSETFGVEWLSQQIQRSNGSVIGGTLGNLGVSRGTGLSLAFSDRSGVLRALFSALSSSSKARLLSSPKVVARNGESATITVGSEVPVITSQQSGGSGNAPGSVLQTVQYRSTGVILKVRPIIHSSTRLDLEISQEVSSAAETRTGVSSSPTISTRKIDTKMSLRDGSTVLLGGLISSSDGNSETGVPFAREIPILGNLFKSQSGSNERTELIMLITPYVINDEFEAESITDAFRGTLGDWSKTLIQNDRLVRPTLSNSSSKTESTPSLDSSKKPAPAGLVEPSSPPSSISVQPNSNTDSPIKDASPELSEPQRGTELLSTPKATTVAPNKAGNPAKQDKPVAPVFPKRAVPAQGSPNSSEALSPRQTGTTPTGAVDGREVTDPGIQDALRRATGK
jgi:general secretion pathway protein D